MSSRFRLASSALLVVSAALLAAPVPNSKPGGSDWPQWRGPNRDGHATDANLLAEWPKDGPKLLWSTKDVADIGTGYGSPAVVGGRMYILGADGSKQTANEFVTCLEAKDGKRVWQRPLTTSPGKFLDGWGGGPRATPTVIDGSVYVLGATGDLVCLAADTGKVEWTKNLVTDFGGVIPKWGYSESVLIDGELLVCTPGAKGGMIALNRKSGRTVWQCTDVSDEAGYSSVVISTAAGVKHYVQQTMASAVGVSTDGKLLWKAGEIARRTAVIPTPVLLGDYAFFTAGYGAGCECFKLEKDGSGLKANTVYTKNKVVANHHGGVIGIGDYVYGHSDSNGWVCFDLKAGGDEPVWKDKGVGKGSVTCADGHLYCYSESTGTLARVKADKENYSESGKFTIPATSTLRPKQGKVWAHPVVADGKLFLRDYELLFVYDVSAK